MSLAARVPFCRGGWATASAALKDRRTTSGASQESRTAESLADRSTMPERSILRPLLGSSDGFLPVRRKTVVACGAVEVGTVSGFASHLFEGNVARRSHEGCAGKERCPDSVLNARKIDEDDGAVGPHDDIARVDVPVDDRRTERSQVSEDFREVGQDLFDFGFREFPARLNDLFEVLPVDLFHREDEAQAAILLGFKTVEVGGDARV